LPHQKSI